MLNVQIVKTRPEAKIPVKSFSDDAGVDLCSCENVSLGPLGTRVIPCGIKIKMEVTNPTYNNWIPEAQIRSRSGLSIRGLIVLNSPGTIDAGYTGEIKVIMHNTSDSPIHITAGDRIAQMVFSLVPQITINGEKTGVELPRAEDGFGSTGLQ